jgi:hypothetical protein
MNTAAAPSLPDLLRRLIDTPSDFVDPPATREGAGVATAALVADLLAEYGARARLDDLAAFKAQPAAAANRLILVSIVVWLLWSEAFPRSPLLAEHLLHVLGTTVTELANEVPAERYLRDADRREELVRVVLHHLRILPAGETLAQAQDRLSRVSGLERRRLLAASRATEARARAVREALVRKAAEESADKWTRE